MVQYARSFFPVILIVLVVRAFVIEPFRIPSASMMPGLVDGDFIFVDKFSYGLRLPVVNTKILRIGEPRRGDVIVFRLPSNPSVHFIKRLVGLPGDHIVVRDNRLTINGQPVPMTPDGIYSAATDSPAPSLRSSDSARNSMSSCSHPAAIPPISRPSCRPVTISSWATTAMTARTAAFPSWASFPSRTSSDTPCVSG